MIRNISLGSISRWVAILGMLSCSSSAPEASIPSVPVYLEANLHSAEYRPLETPGGIVLVDRATSAGQALGYRGLVLVRSLTGTHFYAFDRACPQEGSEGVPLALADDELLCPRCGSRFDVLSGIGVPTAGVARQYLRSYPASYDATSHTLRVVSR